MFALHFLQLLEQRYRPVPLVRVWSLKMKETFQIVQDAQRLPDFSPRQLEYRIDNNTYWFERDLMGFARNRRQLNRQQQWAWLRTAVRRMIVCDGHINWSWRDPVPSLVIARRRLPTILAQFLGK